MPDGNANAARWIEKNLRVDFGAGRGQTEREGARDRGSLSDSFQRNKGYSMDVLVTGGAGFLNDGRVISNFMKQALEGKPLTVYGTGSQTRSFCYVSDEIDGILRLSRSDEHGPVNIGNPGEFTILECARKVIDVTGSVSGIELRSLPQDDPKQRRPDITKAIRLLGWEPQITLEQGLLLSLEYFRAAVEAKKSNLIPIP
jgi:hypothetical protein